MQIPDRRLTLTALGAGLGLWGLIAFFMAARGLHFASADDFPRIVLAMEWARRPFIFPSDYYWLPLPVWYTGTWFAAFGRWLGTFWFIFASAFTMGIATWGLLLLAFEANTFPDLHRSRWRRARVLAVVLTLPLAVSIPFAWRLSATGLSEPLFIALLTWIVLLLVRLARRPAPRRLHWAALLALCVALQWTRYEGWPLAGLAWVAAGWWGHGARGRRGERLARMLPGFLLLALPPLIMMALHARFSGDPFRWLQIPREYSRLEPHISEASLHYRVALLGGLGLRQGLLVVPLALAGFWLGRGERALRLLFLCVLGATLVYFQAAFSNTIGFQPRDRFCVPVLWLAIPAAARAAALFAAGRCGPAGRLAALVALFFFAGQLAWWNARDWGGMPRSEPMLAVAERLGEEARRGAIAVVADPAAFDVNLNLLRIHMGLDRVMDERVWHPAPLPRAGVVYYITPRALAGRQPVEEVAGQRIYRLESWPPDP